MDYLISKFKFKLTNIWLKVIVCEHTYSFWVLSQNKPSLWNTIYYSLEFGVWKVLSQSKPSICNTIYYSIEFGVWKLGETLVVSPATWRCSIKEKRSWGVSKANKDKIRQFGSIPPKVCVYMTHSIFHLTLISKPFNACFHS